MSTTRIVNHWAIGLGALLVLAGAGYVSGNAMIQEWILQFFCFGLFAMSVNLMVNTGGMLSFGHGMYFGLGAYAFCLLLRAGFSVLGAFALTIIIAALISTVLSIVIVRLEGIFFSFITLAVQMLMFAIVMAWSGLTGGEQGLIGGIPHPPFFGIDLSNPWHLYGFSTAVFIISIAVMYAVNRSPLAVAMRLVRDNPQRANLTGIHVLRYRAGWSVIASIFSAIGGLLMGLHISGAYPNFMYWTISGEGLFMIMLGGIGLFYGPLVGAAFLIVLNGIINKFGLPHDMVVGVLILVVVLGPKKGLLESLSQMLGRGCARPSAKAKEV